MQMKGFVFCCSLHSIFFLSIDTDSIDVTVFLRGTCNAPSAILTYAFTGADLLSQRSLKEKKKKQPTEEADFALLPPPLP